MNARSHLLFWAFAAAALAAFVFIFKSILLPFVLGMVIAYLLNPLVAKLGRIGLGRGPAALVILCVFLAAVFSVLSVLAPVLYHELLGFSAEFPGYVDRVAVLLTPYAETLQAQIGPGAEGDLKTMIGQYTGTGMNVAQRVILGLAAGGSVIIDIVSLVIIMPIVAYFMMKEWIKITDWVKDLMPQGKKQTIMDLFKQIDRKLAGFIRGQLSVAFILGVLYAAALTIAGLKYGLLIGFGAGVLSIIPLVGSVVGLVVGVIAAWVQSGEWSFVLIVAGIFLVGQLIEGNILTPRLVGGSVGLHPLWVFFALMAGGSLFGILGMLLAVPVAAVAGVLIAFGIARYKGSAYYTGKEKPKKDFSKKKAL